MWVMTIVTITTNIWELYKLNGYAIFMVNSDFCIHNKQREIVECDNGQVSGTQKTNRCNCNL